MSESFTQGNMGWPNKASQRHKFESGCLRYDGGRAKETVKVLSRASIETLTGLFDESGW